ncbi:sigma-54-dependent Fis family transcriptional regulator [Desulfopila sp. IMCC35006]|uniref:sigma-54 dependent transcriptional regulator n=1 Tax=Desulfopila sp. IMCC35006 TaxID=2569542 RepID=UPI0010AC569C|nr:sigma-54 dependent transcriptional regulator [Desulfopila sp. IMCC35006]TKB25654.1 sigma-54-dependent Fis family transcriptional regulator [Desulfopila sp. IMCC35006]
MKDKILVVDDEEGIRFSFNIFLSEDGYQVSTAATYGEAIDLIEKTAFDLIFADIVMDCHTGIDLLKVARRLQPNTPVVMITGVPSIETATEALRIGALDYIIKPIRQDTLLRVTTVALKHRAIAAEKESCRLNFEAIFRSVKDGIITVDKTFKITEINDAATRICGVLREHVVDQPIPVLAERCDGRCVDAAMKVLETKQQLEIRFIECHFAENPRQVISLTASPLLDADNGLTGAVMVIRDETRLHELERSLEKKREFDHIIGSSERIRKVKALIQELADVQTNVLITGESGTGKELVVEALHRIGNRLNSPLVKVNCAALSDTLLESELFGHVRGAFTGAIRDRMGRFERAHGGTIFLDEIGDISPRMQLRLLRVIESGEFERVGDSKPVKVNIRVVAATNQDLKQKVAAGEFREDLYYRLKVVEIHLPSLRNRRNDIPLLLDHFLKKFNRVFARDIGGISTDAFNILMLHSWPGNVRELENALEHAFVRCRQGVITVEHLPPEFGKLALQLNFGKSADSEEQESRRIRRALVKANWNKTRAAELLGMSRRTIYRKIDQFKINEKM